MDPTRRKILKSGAAATAMAAATRVFAQQGGPGSAGRFYERGPVRIHYQEFGAGVPLLLIAGGGLNTTISALARRLRLHGDARFRAHLSDAGADPAR